MNIRQKIIMSLIFIPFFSGCAAVGVPLTSSPERKLQDAEVMFNDYDRPIPAESLIIEAIQLYKRKNDEVGLAKAYRTYAFFLQSPAVSNWGKYRFMLKKSKKSVSELDKPLYINVLVNNYHRKADLRAGG